MTCPSSPSAGATRAERAGAASARAPPRPRSLPRGAADRACPRPTSAPCDCRGFSDVALGLRTHSTATGEGLKRFLEMLHQSGLTEAVHGYRAMQMVLVQQRLWAHANGRSELLSLFQSLAQTAEELHRIFAGFAGVMLPLKRGSTSSPE